MRLAALVEYDGSAFQGWQCQSDGPTIQGAVERALSRIADRPIRVIAAGRTDRGVHALGQVIHFDTDAARSPHSWLRGANTYLPPEIALLWVREADPAFHARFSAIGRHYRYLTLNRPVRPSVLNNRISWEYRPLDVARMQEAASYLVGTHDFSSFRSIQCQAKTAIRNLHRLDVYRAGDFVVIDASANAFLHHMVRNLAGLLNAIGAGEHAPSWAQEVLQARDRTVAGVTATPDGLYLMRVDYPDQFGMIASDTAGRRFMPLPAI